VQRAYRVVGERIDAEFARAMGAPGFSRMTMAI